MPSPQDQVAWRREIEAVHAEMDRLLAAKTPSTPEERRVRQMQVLALIERRAAADREFLYAARKRPSYRNRRPAGAPNISHQELEPAESMF